MSDLNNAIVAMQPLVRAIVRRELRKAPWLDAEDVVQDANCELLRLRARYDPGKAQFSTIASHRVRGAAKDAVKAQYRRPGCFVGLDALAHEPRSHDDFAQAVLATDFVARVLPRLRPRYRQVLTLRYLQEKLQSEVATMMDVTDARVWQLEHAALRAIRKNLTPDAEVA